jgi:hypothetical protein
LFCGNLVQLIEIFEPFEILSLFDGIRLLEQALSLLLDVVWLEFTLSHEHSPCQLFDFISSSPVFELRLGDFRRSSRLGIDIQILVLICRLNFI